jgi:hypothetical protein
MVLTDIKETSAGLVIDEQISGRLSIRDRSDYLVAEITKTAGRSLELGLEPGTYRITLQQGDAYSRADVTLAPDSRAVLGPADFSSVAAPPSAARGGGEGEEAVPVNLQFAPGVGIFGFDRKATNHVLFGLFGAVGYNLQGLGLSVIGLINTGDVRGVQAGGLFNFIAGDMEGMQMGVIFNLTQRDVRGIQAGGVFNFTGGDMDGVQIASIFNMVRGAFRGVQIGLVNYSGEGSGPRIGLINISKSERVVPIGLVNVIENGILHPAVWYDDMRFLTLGLRSGSKHLYSIISMGVRDQGIDRGLFISRAGFGGEIPLGRFFIDMDFTAGNLMDWNDIDGSDNVLLQARLSAGFKVVEHLGFFGGVSYNCFMDLDGGSYRKLGDPGVSTLRWGDDRTIHQIGFFGGIQF